MILIPPLKHKKIPENVYSVTFSEIF